jgi:hypothetical protein
VRGKAETRKLKVETPRRSSAELSAFRFHISAFSFPLLYPFAPRAAFADVAPLLAATCADTAPFAITLSRFGVFVHGTRGATIYLRPEPAELLVVLQTRLWQALPAYDDTCRHAGGFTPHLSVGEARGAVEAHNLAERLVVDWAPITFVAPTGQLIWRGDRPTVSSRSSVRSRWAAPHRE